uniref:hypothetical protein n=1 Tax=Salmonella sp. s54836 TaxID=3159673 RepID=UPI00398053B2
VELSKPTKRDIQYLKAKDEKVGYVDNASIVSFTDKLDPIRSDDVLYSTLFAQLVANRKYDPYKNRAEWLKYYVHVLKTIYWVVQSDAFLEYKTSDASFSVDKVFLELLASIAVDPELSNLISSTLNAFKNLPGDDNSVKLFYNSSQDGKNGNFQINPATQDSHSNAVMALGGMSFESSEHTSGFLFFKFSSKSTKLFYIVQKAVLINSGYERIREKIKNKIAPYVDEKN